MEEKLEPTIGLEIHAELKTKTKMFCRSVNNPEEKTPNVNICPVCLAHPGTLPVINKKAIEQVIKVGLALGGQIANFTEFDRKNYFYPDIPKGYQISQYKYPIVSGGQLNGVTITRVHLEEDTATSIHEEDGTLIDFNRAGVPLMELVTEPVIKSAKEAADFGRELQLLLRYLGVSEANMEKGEMRVEANVSVARAGKLGTKVEVKNLNSFKAVEKAIDYEIKRMTDLIKQGREKEIVQETRGFDEVNQSTFSQRKKEYSEDYRYFPEPDLPKIFLNEIFDVEELRKSLPELPWQKRSRYQGFGLKEEDIEIYVSNPTLAQYFEEVISPFGDDKNKIRLASNYITSDLLGYLKNKADYTLPEASHFSQLIEMISRNEVSSRGAKNILEKMSGSSASPRQIAEENGWLQESNEEAVKKIVMATIKNHPKVVADYKQGKEASLQFLIGQVMKESRGSVNPKVAAKLLKELMSI